jgi:DNA-binding beta-propeller fold protein YncE
LIRAVPRPLASLIALCCCAAALVFAATASADSIWWSNYEADDLSSASLTGGAGVNIAPAPAVPEGPYGSVVDAATGKLYWANYDGNTISVSALDGSGAATLNTAGATVQQPAGVAIDPAAGKIYWANQGANKISWAALDGSGGGDLDTSGAEVNGPDSVAVYPAAGRFYWANYATNSIGYANLDGSGGGGEVPIPAADLDGPDAVAIDAAANTIYWTNNAGGSIGHASLSGLGAGLVTTAGGPAVQPTGVAVDPEAGRLYYADEGGSGLYSVPPAGGAVQPLVTGAADVSEASYPFIFKAPVRAGYLAPGVPSLARPGATLTCPAGAWAPDLPESFIFRAPQSFSYVWVHGGVVIAGATGPTLTAATEGSYTCEVIARNGAGTTDGGYGGFWEVRAEEEGPHRPLLQVRKLKRSPARGTVTILLTVSGPGTATLTGKEVVRRTVKASGAGVVKLKLATKGKARKRLMKTGKVKVAIKLGFRSTEGAETFISRAVTLAHRIRR